MQLHIISDPTVYRKFLKPQTFRIEDNSIERLNCLIV